MSKSPDIVESVVPEEMTDEEYEKLKKEWDEISGISEEWKWNY